MIVFVDTSGMYAALDRDDKHHAASVRTLVNFGDQEVDLITSNYVLIEAMSLMGRRLGLQSVRDLQNQFVPLLRVHWIDRSLHERAVAALLTANARDLSLVDCASFELMRGQGIDTAFAFDSHFARQGFNCIP